MRTIKYCVIAVLISLATNASALEVDLRDKWVGEYVGACDWTSGSKALKEKQFKLTIRKGYDLELTYNYSNRDYNLNIIIIIPKEYKKLKEFELIENSIKLSPTAGRPQEFIIDRGKGPFNDEILKGALVFYQLTSDGKASVLIKVSQFAAGKKN